MQFRLDAEWITTKKDLQNAQKRAKEHACPLATPQEHTGEHPELSDPTLNGLSPDLTGGAGVSSKITETSRNSAAYQPEMDAMRCILYSHGGTDTLILRRLSGDVACPRWLLLWQCGSGTVSSCACIRSLCRGLRGPWFTAIASSAMLVKYMDEFSVSLRGSNLDHSHAVTPL